MSDITTIFSDPNILLVLKIVILIATSLYAIFSFVVLRQVKLMNDSFNTPYGVFFRLLALLHLIAVLIVLVLSLIIL